MGVEFWHLPLKWLVTLIKVLHYRAACENCENNFLLSPTPVALKTKMCEFQHNIGYNSPYVEDIINYLHPEWPT